MFFVAMMASIAVYSSSRMLGRAQIAAFVLIYVLTHISLIALSISDRSYYGALLTPLALLDYAALIYTLAFIWKRTNPAP